jgi:hypothetical protein
VLNFCYFKENWAIFIFRTSFTLGALVLLVKAFRVFRLKHISFVVLSVDTVRRCTTSYLLAGPGCL